MKPEDITLLLQISELAYQHKKTRLLNVKLEMWELIDKYKKLRKELEFDENGFPMPMCENCGEYQLQMVRPGKMQCPKCG